MISTDISRHGKLLDLKRSTSLRIEVECIYNNEVMAKSIDPEKELKDIRSTGYGPAQTRLVHFQGSPKEMTELQILCIVL